MPVAQFSTLHLRVNEARRNLETVTEADVRDAYGEPVPRPSLPAIPTYLYEAVIHDMDEDQKSHDAEVDARRRALGGMSPV
jgi:hypothetical protein